MLPRSGGVTRTPVTIQCDTSYHNLVPLFSQFSVIPNALICLSDAKLSPESIFSGDHPSRMTDGTLSPDPRTKNTLSPDSDTASVSSSLKRPHRPPDLDLSSLNLTPIQHHDITVHTHAGPRPSVEQSHDSQGGREEQKSRAPPPEVEGATREKKRETSVLSSVTAQSDFDPTGCSTPTTAKMSGSVSERISLVPISQRICEKFVYPVNVLF